VSDQLSFGDVADDSGAATQDRYRYQHHCVARHLLLALIEGRELAVVCEYQEDFIVLEGETTEAVSVKHRELSRGPWTLATITSEGGLRKLFETWRDGERVPTCRLMTNAGLAPGKAGARSVAEFNADGNKYRKVVVEDLSQRFSTPSAPVAEFLKVALRVDAELPSRSGIETQQRIDLLGPTYGALGESAEASAAEYRALLELIHERSADTNPIETDIRLALVAGGAEQKARMDDARIRARTVTTGDAAEHLCKARIEPYPALPPASEASPATRMRRKLQAGRLSPTEIRLAARLRSHWYAAEAEQRDTPNVEDEIAGLEAEVQAAAGASQREAGDEVKDRPYGGVMLGKLRERLDGPQAPTPRREFAAPKLLEGLAYELTDRCEIWWSPEEDVDLEGLDPDATSRGPDHA
jgi:hypothetical protein